MRIEIAECMDKGPIFQKGQGRTPAPRRRIETFRNSHLELGFQWALSWDSLRYSVW